jgi:hypothetical protein
LSMMRFRFAVAVPFGTVATKVMSSGDPDVADLDPGSEVHRRARREALPVDVDGVRPSATARGHVPDREDEDRPRDGVDLRDDRGAVKTSNTRWRPASRGSSHRC